MSKSRKPTKNYNFCQSRHCVDQETEKRGKRKREKKNITKNLCYGGIGKLVSRYCETSICYFYLKFLQFAGKITK